MEAINGFAKSCCIGCEQKRICVELLECYAKAGLSQLINNGAYFEPYAATITQVVVSWQCLKRGVESCRS